MNDNERVILGCLLNNTTDLQTLLIKVLGEGVLRLPDADEMLRLDTSTAQLSGAFLTEYRYWERTAAHENEIGT